MNAKILGLLALGLTAIPGIGYAAAVLQQMAPNAVTFTEGTDYSVLGYAGAGDVTASVQAVDLSLGFGNLSTSGCEAADFAGFVAGFIALIQRGSCTFETKAENAAAAGAAGVLIFNQGNDPNRIAVFDGSLTSDYTGGLSVFSLSYGLGAQFAQTPGLVLRMYFDGVFPVPTPTPEPGTLALLGLGLAGLGLNRRRKAA